ncbi:hypothetical protein D3OALGB2SA_3526 [Olavius algarvensis associated proteobacterium Delta 3]|nr:hypothetical protein D3OALGB2SA_3526 [Olavius algarvensis associated proteobacterium Delta 3]
MKRTHIWIAFVALIGLGLGFARLQIDVDVFNLLPAGSRMVDGLKLFQRNFGSTQELIISLRTADPEKTAQATRSLAEELKRSGLTSRVIWRSPFHGDPAQLAELLAYSWYNQPPEKFEALVRKLQAGRLAGTIGETIERMATSLQPQEVARLSYDPLALSDLAASMSTLAAGAGSDPFAPGDGTFRIMFVSAVDETAGFWTYRRWVAKVSETIATWKPSLPFDNPMTIRITGNPAFVSETGSSLMKDILLAAVGTLLMVAGLFWVVHRRWIPLAWLVALLVLVLTITVSLGSLILGTLNAVSLGFAAILMGLAADYALILYQEFRAAPGDSPIRTRNTVAPSILWAALTTAGAFFMIGLSSLPGLTQLGILVGVGILVAAGIMLTAFLPAIAGRVRPDTANGAETRWITGVMSLGSRTAWVITILAAVVCLAVLVGRLPAVDYGTRNLGPKESSAMAALQEIQRDIGGHDDDLWLIVEGADEGDVAHRMISTGRMLDRSVDEKLLAGYSMPEALWPRPDAQQMNRNHARLAVARLPAVTEAAVRAGYMTESLVLTEHAFAAWKRFSETDGVVWPSHPGSKWVFEKFAGNDSGRLLVLGRLEAAPTSNPAGLQELAGRIYTETGGLVFGWSLLSESLLEIMARDIRRVLIPMGVVLLLLLGAAFRNAGEVTLSIVTLGFSLLCLMSIMALAGWSWNLMNVMALPLLFGAGVDYSIHIQFAMRRYRGDMARVRRTVGRAILLCGASTAAGFGSLGLASNAGLASLGRVCAAGIIITSLIAVFLLPAWWQTLQRKTHNQIILEAP